MVAKVRLLDEEKRVSQYGSAEKVDGRNALIGIGFSKQIRNVIPIPRFD
jgi:hypothetical protein